jgi:hydroxymethylglutaryl-CoA lyase
MNNASMIKLVECPRDAMQGWKTFIPTATKIDYLNALLKVGFDTLDCGSFVSAKAIPQMADTKEVISGLSMDNSKTKLLVIVANTRGAEEAVRFNEVTYVGFPFSISETFQLRNTNSTIAESLKRVGEIQQLCIASNKQLVIYLSMGFGNPYGDTYNQEILLHWAAEMTKMGVKIISLADTVGVASPEKITVAFDTLIPTYPDVTFGVHLHSTSVNWQQKFEAALNAGCTRFDGALKGIGGCPMANDELVGNMNTEWMIDLLQQKDLAGKLDVNALQVALQMANEIFV